MNRPIICRYAIIADSNQKRCRKRFWQKCGHVTHCHTIDDRSFWPCCHWDYPVLLSRSIINIIINAIIFILIIIISQLSSLTVPGPPRSIKAVVSGPSSVVVSWLPPERPAGQVIQVQHTTFCFHHLCFFSWPLFGWHQNIHIGSSTIILLCPPHISFCPNKRDTEL